MSTWIKKDDRTWCQRLVTYVMKQGPIPKHVGFIMDGNRRFAKKSHLPNIEGHTKGFDKLAETLRWCLDFGVNEVTVYVFSIENFKRTKEEVDSLMNLATEKFKKLLEEKDKIMEEGVCVQIIGDWSLIPNDLKALMAEVMVLTRHNVKAKLNVAFAYTSRNEIRRGIQSCLEGVKLGDISSTDISEDLLEECFKILPSQPLDLLLRTSGETRLSDFLLWQSAETVLCFTSVLWPEFTFWHLVAAIFDFQVNHMSLNKIMQLKRPKIVGELKSNENGKSRTSMFVDKLKEEKWKSLEYESEGVFAHK